MNIEDFFDTNLKTLLRDLYLMPPATNEIQCLNLWTIMSHITEGQVHIHSCRDIHRDLKLRNGSL